MDILAVVIKNIRYINFINKEFHVMISTKAAKGDYSKGRLITQIIKKPQCGFWCAEERGRKEPT